MLDPDTDIKRHLVRERQAALAQDWQWINPARPDAVETRRRHRRLRLTWFGTQLRPARRGV